jgi:hypothetical protein
MRLLRFFLHMIGRCSALSTPTTKDIHRARRINSRGDYNLWVKLVSQPIRPLCLVDHSADPHDPSGLIADAEQNTTASGICERGQRLGVVREVVYIKCLLKLAMLAFAGGDRKILKVELNQLGKVIGKVEQA